MLEDATEVAHLAGTELCRSAVLNAFETLVKRLDDWIRKGSGSDLEIPQGAFLATIYRFAGRCDSC